MMSITLDNLISLYPSLDVNRATAFLSDLNAAMEQFEINTVKRASAFLAQILIESDGFKHMQENLYYTTPKRLMQVWPRAFPTLDIAKEYLRNPEKLANRVYSGTYNKWLGNGDEQSGDGWKFSGKGLIQLTGRYNFSQASKELNIDLVNNPNLVLESKYACLTSAWFFKSRGLNELADKGLFDQLTGKVNTAKLHLIERRNIYYKALNILKES